MASPNKIRAAKALKTSWSRQDQLTGGEDGWCVGDTVDIIKVSFPGAIHSWKG
jgi:hypothetical protein